MFDIFYAGKQPLVPGHARCVRDIEQARQLSRTRFFWWCHYLADLADWDWLWEPPPWQQHQRHAWHSQHQRDCGMYLVPKHGYQETNYHPEVIDRLPDPEFWTVPDYVDAATVDFTWHPDPTEPPFIYHFSVNPKWNNTGGVLYSTPRATDVKYSDCLTIRTQSRAEWWHIPSWIDATSIDFTWCPHPEDPPFVYEFPVEWGWARVGGAQYRVPGAENIKYVDDFVCRTRPGSAMQIKDKLAEDDIVRRWRPNPKDPPYIYVFGNQWWPAEKRTSAEYRTAGATEYKYMSAPRSLRLPDRDCYRVLVDHSTFDFSWEPDPGDPPYIYVFGNQWWSAEKMPTVEYHTPGATERKFMTAPRATLGTNPNDHWTPLTDCTWDTSWCPDPGDPPYIYVFGNQWWPAETWPTLEYRVPGATEKKYVTDARAMLPADPQNWHVPEHIDPHSVDFSWRPDPGSPAYVYQFGTQWQKTGGATYVVPGATEVKYVSAFQCRKISKDPHWEMPANLADIMQEFDWTWHPDHTEQPYIYEFGSQHQKTGGPVYRVPGATETKYVDQIRVQVSESRAPAVLIDHMEGDVQAVYAQICDTVSVIKTSRYVVNYLDTLKRIAAQVEDEWIWIVSSVCDYRGFDFTWYPEQWQSTLLHVFASDDLKFGDTFFMHVPTFREKSRTTKLLEWYDINFVQRSVPRRPVPVIKHDHDCHTDIVARHQTRAPVSLFTVGDPPANLPAVNLWRSEVKAVIPLDPGSCSVMVPREAISAVKTQLYDYPHIDKTHMDNNSCEPLDIVFISNGESNADQNWARLLLSKQGRPNRCVRVDGVNGRAAAYHAAAEASETPWFFAVFAKLEVLDNFDWSWQPDRLQQPKHYIFHALNPVNMLEYGHQAMIAYNRALTLTNPGRGLDFTLDDAHEVVPILSGVARYNVDAWTAWRTAFREVIKLRASLPDVESEYRIRQWVSKGNGPHGQHSRDGAQDALDYYEEVKGDFAELRKSYEWSWLASYALVRRNLAPGQ